MKSIQTERLIDTLHAIEIALLKQSRVLDKIQESLNDIRSHLANISSNT